MIVHNGDTLIAITRHQLDVLNVVRVDNERYKELVRNQQKRLEEQQILLISKKETVSLLQSNRVDVNKITVSNDKLVATLRTTIASLEVENQKYKRQRDKAYIATGTIILIEVIHYAIAVLFSN